MKLFFFQAEDGIRDFHVTGVQTCALPIFDGEFLARRLEVDPAENAADITLEYETGERYRLGSVTFLEGHGFEQNLLEQFVTFERSEERRGGTDCCTLE